MTAPPVDPETLADELWRDLLTAFSTMQATAVLARVARAILANQVTDAVQALEWQHVRNAMADLQDQLGPMRGGGWLEAAASMPQRLQRTATGQETLGGAALRNARLLTDTRQMDLWRIGGITEETRAAIEEVLQRGIAKGTHPNVLAEEMQGMIGLNRKQALAVERYRDSLAGRPPAQITRMVQRFTQQKRLERAKTIAITETYRARNEGRMLKWRQMVADGVIREGEFEQMWATARDERTCPVCWPLHGQRAEIGAAFTTLEGPVEFPPVHPRCRCVVVTILKGTRGGASPTPRRDALLTELGRFGG